MTTALVWFRRDLRLTDNPALQAALEGGYAPVPVYLHAPHEEGDWAPGAASQAWLGRSLAALDIQLRTRGSRLILRRTGSSLDALIGLAAQCDAKAVFWNRLYEPVSMARDGEIKSALRGLGMRAESFNAALLAEPWSVQTGSGDPYRVFTPFWKSLSQRIDAQVPWQPPARLPVPDGFDVLAGLEPALDGLELSPALGWDDGFWSRFEPGEVAASKRLEDFIQGQLAGYAEHRDRPDLDGCSRLSPHLHFGEIGPRQIHWRLRRIADDAGLSDGAAVFLRELGWREFAHHLLYHFPRSCVEDFNPRFAEFPWNGVEDEKRVAWQRGRTGIPIVDAGMRELWATGWMHNRVRMIVGSLLTRNLRYHWRHGARWFWDTLVDADLANNTAGWQWIGGTGADAAPYFRIFNPISQARKFDPEGAYVRRWVPELAALPDKLLAEPWTDPGRLARLAPEYPRQPIVDLKASREAALAAYRDNRREQS